MRFHALLGVLIEIFLADSLSVLGLAGQKLCAMRYRVTHDLEEVKVLHLLKSPLWIASLVVFVLGNVLEAVALGFASEGAVVAAGTLTIFWNAIFSVMFFGETFTLAPPNRVCSWRLFQQWDLFSYVVLLVGSIMTVLACPPAPNDAKDTAAELIQKWVEAPYCYFALAEILLSIAFGVFLCKNWTNEKIGNWNAALNGVLCALLGSFTLTMSKVTTTLLKNSFAKQNQYDNIDAWAMTIVYILLLVLQVYLLNLALSAFEQALFVPIYEAASTIVTITTGLLYWKTYNEFGPTEFAWFVIGMLLMLWGILLVAHREPHSTKEIAQNFRCSRGKLIFLQYACVLNTS